MKSWKKFTGVKKKPKVALPRKGQIDRAQGPGGKACSVGVEGEYENPSPELFSWKKTRPSFRLPSVLSVGLLTCSWLPFPWISPRASGSLLPTHHISITLKKSISKTPDFTQPIKNILYSQYPLPWSKLSGDPTRDVGAQLSEGAFEERKYLSSTASEDWAESVCPSLC